MLSVPPEDKAGIPPPLTQSEALLDGPQSLLQTLEER